MCSASWIGGTVHHGGKTQQESDVAGPAAASIWSGSCHSVSSLRGGSRELPPILSGWPSILVIIRQLSV